MLAVQVLKKRRNSDGLVVKTSEELRKVKEESCPWPSALVFSSGGTVAAHTGESGKGFAVVAGEIRKR
jgi:hypothetical protein